MYTKEDLLIASSFAKYVNKHGGTYRGVISKSELESNDTKRNSSITTISCFDKNNDPQAPARSYYFFSDDHCFGIDVLPKCFVPITTQFPIFVTPRPGVEDGVVDTIDKFICVFHHNDIRIESIDDLVEFLNKTPF